jgi:hypothetical protein
MASFKSILEDIGHGLATFFKDAVPAAEVAEPVIDLLFPGLALIYNSAVAAAVKAEAVAISASQQNGTGAQKFSLALSEVEPIFTQWYQSQYGSTPTLTTIENWLNAVVATLNAIPAPAAASSPASSSSNTSGTTTPSVQEMTAKGNLL